MSEGPPRLLRGLPRAVLRPEAGTMPDETLMEEMEVGGEKTAWELSGLTLTELKNGKLLADREAGARLFAAQLL